MNGKAASSIQAMLAAVVAFLVVPAAPALAQAAPEAAIIPQPLRIEPREGVFQIDASTVVVVSPGDAEAVAVLEREYWIDRDLRTTCVPTLLSAGTAENVLPTSATATINCRVFPGETVDATRDALVHAIDDPDVDVTVVGNPVASTELAAPDDASRSVDRLLAERAPGSVVVPYMEAGATDGVHFRSAGIPTLGAGAVVVFGEHDLAYHASDEALQVASFEHGLDHFYGLIKALE